MTTSSLYRAYLTESLRRSAAEADAAWDVMVERVAQPGLDRTPLQTGAGIPLIVTLARYPRSATEDEVLAGTTPEYVELSEDGRYIRPQEWETEPSGDEVYYERWENGVRVGHGWIDKESRRLVQSG